MVQCISIDMEGLNDTLITYRIYYFSTDVKEFYPFLYCDVNNTLIISWWSFKISILLSNYYGLPIDVNGKICERRWIFRTQNRGRSFNRVWQRYSCLYYFFYDIYLEFKCTFFFFLYLISPNLNTCA